MNEFHNLIPDLATLDKKANEVFDEFVSEVDWQIEVVRQPVREAGIRTSFSLLAVVLSILSANFLTGLLAVLLIFISSVYLFLFGWRLHKEYRIYVAKVTSLFVPMLNKLFAVPITHTPETDHIDETKTLFKESGLALEHYDRLVVDDMYFCKEPYQISFREVMTTKQEGGGKNRRTVTVFKGMFVRAVLPKPLEGNTYISTEAEKHKIEHETFWQQIIGEKSSVKETVLEWNDFEKDLHVASDNPIEARYILTPNFMTDLYDWWLEGKENIRICFKDNQMMMLLPDVAMAVGTAPFFGGSEALRKHLFTVAKPLWRTLTLVEDVRL